MLQHRRSRQSRDLESKYAPDWSNRLGEGAYGSVHIAKRLKDDERVALKKISKKYTDESSFKRETEALLLIHDSGGHPNVCGLRDMYEDNKHFYLILDLITGGEMFEHLIQNGAYSEHDAARLMTHVASALNFLHGIGIVHADLKPENLMLSSWNDKNAVVKMVDFGCAVIDNEEEGVAKRGLSRSDGGTTAYWPPELFEVKTKTFTARPAMDMWSLGVILYIMLTGMHPFDLNGTASDEDIEDKIRKNPEPVFSRNLTGHLSPSAVDLIKRLMTKDTEKRITAREMLNHPWMLGETTNKYKMAGSDRRLNRYREVREKLEAGVFAVLVSGGVKNNRVQQNEMMIERAFEVFDADNKGFFDVEDLGRVMSERGVDLDEKDKKDLMDSLPTDKKRRGKGKKNVDLSSFSDLMSNLNTVYFAKNQHIFQEGEKGDRMYFINAGKVKVTLDGMKLGTLGAGDFFGEGSMLNPSKTRSATVTALTPVEVMEIPRHDYERYVKGASFAKSDMKAVRNSRMLTNAKSLIRLQKNLVYHDLVDGQDVFKEGDVGSSMYTVASGKLKVASQGVDVAELSSGDIFGEVALLMKRPRSSTIGCISKHCKVLEMKGEDFMALVDSTPDFEASLRDLSRRREFKKALKKAKKGENEKPLRELFDMIDVDKDGKLSALEVKTVLRNFDESFPDEEVNALVQSMDLDGSGYVTWKEFKRVVGLEVWEGELHRES